MFNTKWKSIFENNVIITKRQEKAFYVEGIHLQISKTIIMEILTDSNIS